MLKSKYVAIVIMLGALLLVGGTISMADDSESITDDSDFEPCSVAAADTEAAWGTAPEEIVLDNKAFKRNYVGPVAFSHKAHNTDYEVRCASCHHFQESSPNPEWNCAECHDPQKKIGRTVNLKNAYHLDCRGCHQDVMEKGEAEEAPFRKCNECHEEQEKS